MVIKMSMIDNIWPMTLGFPWWEICESCEELDNIISQMGVFWGQ
jgi:hypothetical protein